MVKNVEYESGEECEERDIWDLRTTYWTKTILKSQSLLIPSAGLAYTTPPPRSLDFLNTNPEQVLVSGSCLAVKHES